MSRLDPVLKRSWIRVFWYRLLKSGKNRRQSGIARKLNKQHHDEDINVPNKGVGIGDVLSIHVTLCISSKFVVLKCASTATMLPLSSISHPYRLNIHIQALLLPNGLTRMFKRR